MHIYHVFHLQSTYVGSISQISCHSKTCVQWSPWDPKSMAVVEDWSQSGVHLWHKISKCDHGKVTDWWSLAQI
jgi:hypothetical protein